jgi:hypothetical protein
MRGAGTRGAGTRGAGMRGAATPGAGTRVRVVAAAASLLLVFAPGDR